MVCKFQFVRCRVLSFRLIFSIYKFDSPWSSTLKRIYDWRPYAFWQFNLLLKSKGASLLLRTKFLTNLNQYFKNNISWLYRITHIEFKITVPILNTACHFMLQYINILALFYYKDPYLNRQQKTHSQYITFPKIDDSISNLAFHSTGITKKDFALLFYCTCWKEVGKSWGKLPETKWALCFN